MTSARHKWNRIKLRLPDLNDKRLSYLLLLLIVGFLVYGFMIRQHAATAPGGTPNSTENYLTTTLPLLLAGLGNIARTARNGRKLDDVKEKAAETADIANKVAHQTNGGLTERLERNNEAVIGRVHAQTQAQLDDMRAQITGDMRRILEEDTIQVARLVQGTREDKKR